MNHTCRSLFKSLFLKWHTCNLFISFSGTTETLNSEDQKVHVIETTVTIRTRITFNLPPSITVNNLDILFSGKKEYWQKELVINVYPNRITENYKSWVSIEMCIPGLPSCQGICIVGLIDSSNVRRFTRSFTISYTATPYFVIEKYISQDTLLRDEDDLLPDGILTLVIYMHLILYPDESVESDNFTMLEVIGHLNPFVPEIRLDSELAKRLSEESTFFRAILDVEMIEKRTKVMRLPDDEISDFKSIALLCLKSNRIEFSSEYEILRMYVIADKYDISLAMETSTCFMKLYASVHGVDKFLKCVNECHDKFLKDLLVKQIKEVSKTNFADEISKTDVDVCMKFPVCGSLWVYIFSEDRTEDIFRRIIFKNVVNFLSAEKRIEEKFLKKYHTGEYDFYK